MNLAQRITRLAASVGVTLVLSLLAVLLQGWSGASDCLGYEWANFAWGQSYRIITCNWLHFSWNHLGWDLAVFAVLAGLCERRSRPGLLWMLSIASISIPLAVQLMHVELKTYRGLSGIDSGLFAMLALSLAIEHARSNDWRMVAIFVASLSALIAKIAWEIQLGGNIFVSDQSFIPLPVAHMTGVLIGLSIAVVAAIKQMTPIFAFNRYAKLECKSDSG